MELAVLTDQDIVTADTPTLRKELARQITITAQSLQYMGLIWMELERRGEDLSDLRGGLADYLPMIASGRLRAEIVVRYAGKIMLLKALSVMPVEKQDKILETGAVEIVADNEDESLQVVPLASIRSDQVRLAFGPYGLRSIREQRQALYAQRAAAPQQKSQHFGPAYISVDKNSGALRSGRQFVVDKNQRRINVEDLLDMLSLHFDVSLRAILGKAGKYVTPSK